MNVNITNKGMITIRNNISLINQILGKYNNYREKYLRIRTILEHYSKTPASVIYTIIYIWLNAELNA